MKISIITITYNSASYLPDTIGSIRAQSYPNLEFIVVDGGSNDGTLDIIKSNADIITKWVSEPDNGISDAFNKGIRMATGDVIGIINSDDMLAANALSTINARIEADTDVFYGNVENFGDDIDKTYVTKPGELSGLYVSMTLIHPAVFVRKSAYDKYGVFNLDYKCCMDRDLLLRMYSNGAKFQYVDETLARYRHGGINQRTYVTTTVVEGEKISIEYGMSKPKAKLITAKKRLRFTLRSKVLNTSIGRKLRARKYRDQA